jgi:hypothetical protein
MSLGMYKNFTSILIFLFRFNSKNFDIVVLENSISNYAANKELKMKTLNKGPLIPHMKLTNPKTKVSLVFKGETSYQNLHLFL